MERLHILWGYQSITNLVEEIHHRARGERRDFKGNITILVCSAAELLGEMWLGE
jgi:hypothetical protein